jgi:ADP-ribosyl-[dinitrogen reductase] hydrolase
MASDHKRNVGGMHRARRCGARKRDGSECGSPAVRGKKRCRIHGGKGSPGKPYRREFSDYSKANLERDKRIREQSKKLEKVIRTLEGEGGAPEPISDLVVIARALRDLTKQKRADLAAACVAPPADRTAERDYRAVLANSVAADRSLEMVRDRARGAMLGLAIGEAVGLGVDGFPRDSFREFSDMRGGGKVGLNAGEWAADTATALALLDSLRFRNGFDEIDFMERLLEWRDEGIYSCTGTCVGMDKSTGEALATYSETQNPIAEDRGGKASNGSLVRIAPLAIRYWNDRRQLRDVAARQSRTTHPAAEAVDACVAFAELLADAISGCVRSDVLGSRELAHSSSVRWIMAGSWKGKQRGEIASDAYVMNSLEAALWCVDRTWTYEDAVLMAAHLGEDAGTIAALTGQLAGALYGVRSIPSDWLKRLAWCDRLIDGVDALFERTIEDQPHAP